MIIFRNWFHGLWFVVSMFGLLVGILTRKNFKQYSLIHLSTSLFAVLFVFVLKVPDDRVFSIDCVWFNAVMALVHGVLYYRYRKSQGGQTLVRVAVVVSEQGLRPPRKKQKKRRKRSPKENWKKKRK